MIFFGCKQSLPGDRFYFPLFFMLNIFKSGLSFESVIRYCL
jgi:hypothetical protein